VVEASHFVVFLARTGVTETESHNDFVVGITAKAMVGCDNWQRALVFGVQLATAVAIG
jgi:hypothetical protein